MKKITLLFCLITSIVFSQKQVSGNVTDGSGASLIGVNVFEKGTSNGVSTDLNGAYKITVKDGSTLVFTYVGFVSQEKKADASQINVVLADSQQLNEVTVTVGSRNSKRTIVNSAVPIDIIDVKNVTTQSGKLEINELLQYVAPSFNANKQSGSDGADHVDPASLRGMGPDQTLVLINGKRRHQSSLINLLEPEGVEIQERI